jgi:hypothetical protein
MWGTLSSGRQPTVRFFAGRLSRPAIILSFDILDKALAWSGHPWRTEAPTKQRAVAHDCGYDGPPCRWDEARCFLLRCELDAAYFHLYGIAHDDVDYIMDTFPIVRRKDEAATANIAPSG